MTGRTTKKTRRRYTERRFGQPAFRSLCVVLANRVAHEHCRSRGIRSLQSLSFRIHSLDLIHSLRQINLLVSFVLAVKQATGELPVPITRSPFRTQEKTLEFGSPSR